MKRTATSHRQDVDTEIRKDQTVGDLVIRHPGLRLRLEQLGIDYCCGGKKPLMEAVQENGLVWTTVVSALQAELHSGQNTAETDWSVAPLTVLTDHILEKHHAFMKEQLPRLDVLLARVQKAHGAKHGDMLGEIRRVFDSLHAEFDAHLMKEEQMLFPAIKGIDAFMSGTGPRPVVQCGSIVHPIRQMEYEHAQAGEKLVEMRRIASGGCVPELRGAV